MSPENNQGNPNVSQDKSLAGLNDLRPENLSGGSSRDSAPVPERAEPSRPAPAATGNDKE